MKMKIVLLALLLSVCILPCVAEDIDELEEGDYILMPEWNELEDMDADEDDEPTTLIITPADIKAAAASCSSVLDDGRTIVAICEQGAIYGSAADSIGADAWGDYERCILLITGNGKLLGAIEYKPDGTKSALISTEFF